MINNPEKLFQTTLLYNIKNSENPLEFQSDFDLIPNQDQSMYSLVTLSPVHGRLKYNTDNQQIKNRARNGSNPDSLEKDETKDENEELQFGRYKKNQFKYKKEVKSNPLIFTSSSNNPVHIPRAISSVNPESTTNLLSVKFDNESEFRETKEMEEFEEYIPYDDVENESCLKKKSKILANENCSCIII